MAKGDIILIPFPFTDLSGNKLRPALILAESRLDITVCFITTQILNKELFDIPLKPTEVNGLKKSSLLRIGKLATLDKSLSIGRIGWIEASTQNEVNRNLKELFQI